MGGQGGQGADHVHVALHGAVGRLRAPDGHQNLAGHAEAVLDGRQPTGLGRTVFGPPQADSLFRNGAAHIVADGLGQLRLAAVQGRHARVRRQAGKLALQQGGGEALGGRALVKALQPGVEPCVAGSRRRAGGHIGLRRLARLRPGSGQGTAARISDSGGGQDKEKSTIHGIQASCALADYQ